MSKNKTVDRSSIMWDIYSFVDHLVFVEMISQYRSSFVYGSMSRNIKR